jgi:ribosomal peptide maturation radical SAM protein 1
MTRPAALIQVRFIVVPFLPTEQPALGVSSLLSVLSDRGIGADVHYLNLAYGERLGWDVYKAAAEAIPQAFLPGEMIFSRALWGERAPDFAQYNERIVRWIERTISGSRVKASLATWERHAGVMRKLIADAPGVVAEWADTVLAGSPRVLGFTSTFQQNVAALALAQEVRRRVPATDVAIVFGGANCEDDMGRALASNFDFIDCVVSGEAEQVIVDLVGKLLDRRPVERFLSGTMVQDMDALPLPAFDDYFEMMQRTSYRDETRLAAESSRGCWWGMKSHCTFCGLNGGTMAFRSKSAARFAAELETLSERYGSSYFCLTDNILDMTYLRTLLPELVAQGKQYRLFYETKSNLRKEHVELLAAAGVTALQPGIESLSTPILKLMGKGTSRLQNVQLLKWSVELRVWVTWNLLYGFPGEEPGEYDEMADLLPSLYHLPAPTGAAKIRLDRFGPYWKSPERHGLVNVRPFWSYDFAFAGVPDQERARLAYFFEGDYADGREPETYTQAVIKRTGEWRRAARAKARLELRTSDSGPFVFDTRPGRRDEVFPLTPAALALVRALDGFRSRASLVDAVQRQGIEVSEAECERLLHECLTRRFVIEENGICLSVIVDPEQHHRVAERRVSMRMNRLGFQWPEDFPDQAQQQIVRLAVLGPRQKRSAAPVA